MRHTEHSQHFHKSIRHFLSMRKTFGNSYRLIWLSGISQYSVIEIFDYEINREFRKEIELVIK